MVWFTVSNKESVAEYLEDAFSRRRPQKKKSFYYNMIKLYNHYPKTMTQVIDQLPRLGYWKDYLFILQYSHNEQLNDYIYDLLLSQFRQDIHNDKNGLPISSLAKWLPRQSSSFDRKLGFIDKFNSMMYPGMEKFAARRRYRQTVSHLTSKLGVPEVKLCAKEYDKINFDSVGPISMMRNKPQFEKHCSEELEDHIFHKYTTYKLWKFCHKICKREFSAMENKSINDAWLKNYPEFKEEAGFMDFPKAKILIDFSQEVYRDYLHLVVATCLVLKQPIYINSKKPIEITFDDDENVIDRVDTLMNSMAYHKNVQWEQLTEDEDEIILVLTNRPPPNCITQTNNLLWWQFSQTIFNKEGNLISGNPYIKKISNGNSKIIQEILDASDELRSSNKLEYALIGGFVGLMGLMTAGYFIGP